MPCLSSVVYICSPLVILSVSCTKISYTFPVIQCSMYMLSIAYLDHPNMLCDSCCCTSLNCFHTSSPCFTHLDTYSTVWINNAQYLDTNRQAVTAWQYTCRGDWWQVVKPVYRAIMHVLAIYMVPRWRLRYSGIWWWDCGWSRSSAADENRGNIWPIGPKAAIWQPYHYHRRCQYFDQTTVILESDTPSYAGKFSLVERNDLPFAPSVLVVLGLTTTLNYF